MLLDFGTAKLAQDQLIEIVWGVKNRLMEPKIFGWRFRLGFAERSDAVALPASSP